jgi:hypothetical protein
MPGGQVRRGIGYVDHPFGKWYDATRMGTSRTLHQMMLLIAKDHSVVTIADRFGNSIKMTREDLLSMMRIIHREFPLDLLGDV